MTEIVEDAWHTPGAHAVAAGVHRLVQPLPGDALRGVNVYAVDDGADGVCLVDGGWAVPGGLDALTDALARIGRHPSEVSRVVVTHLHRDHYTLAIELRQRFGTPVLLGAGERDSLELLATRRSGRFEENLPRWGLPLERLGIRPGAHGSLAAGVRETVGYEAPDEWIEGERALDVGGRTLRAIPTPGHTHGHVVLADLDAGLLFSGDHVLPHITPSIGFEAVLRPHPLRDFLESLERVLALPDLALLPAHGPTGGWSHARVRDLLAFHERRLELSADALRAGAATPYEVARLLPWTRRARQLGDLDAYNTMLAVSETAAHLDVLALRGEAHRADVDGVLRYTVG